MKSETLLNVGTAVVVLCTLIVTGLFLKREFQQKQAGEPVTSEVENWQKYATQGHQRGPQTAKVTIVEFSDFQCPFCRAVRTSLRSIEKRYPSDVKFVYRHFPIDQIHPHARQAAHAAECSGAQGRFWQFHEALFAAQDSIGKTPWTTFARQAGADSAAFVICLESQMPANRLAHDTDAAAELAISSTPTFLINNTLVVGAPDEAFLTKIVERGLRGAK